jgi:hypothetical protein
MNGWEQEGWTDRWDRRRSSKGRRLVSKVGRKGMRSMMKTMEAEQVLELQERNTQLIRPGSDGGSGYWIPTSCWSVC